jgi:hypothetical protein
MKHEYIIRASSVGALMTKGKTKDKEWGDTAISEIRKAVLFNKYGIREELNSKYLEKGIYNEMESLLTASRVYNWNFDVMANKQRFVNEFVTGEPDVYRNNPELLGDVKSSWDASTFPFMDTQLKNKTYEYQMQTYIWLTGINEVQLCYVLTNTPEHMINDQIQRLMYKLSARPENVMRDLADIEFEAEKIVKQSSIFDQIPIENRVKRFIVKRNDETIEAIKQRVEGAREIYDQIYRAI